MTTTANIKGKTFHWDFAPLGKYLNVGFKTKVWHLFDDDDYYHGNFPTKERMMEYIESIEE